MGRKRPKGFRLGVTKNGYSRLVRRMADYLANTHSVNVVIEDQDSCNGKTRYDPITNKAYEVQLNVHVNESDKKSCYKGKNLLGKDTVYYSDIVVLDLINTVFHEGEHCRQNLELCHQPTQLGRDLACSFIARNHNDDFYSMYYPAFAIEADAECSAIRDTYNYLQDNFKRISGSSKDKIMVDFVNFRCEHPQYPLRVFGHLKYKNMRQIYDDVTECYEKSQTSDISDMGTYAYDPEEYVDDSDDKRKSDDVFINMVGDRYDLVELVDEKHSMREKAVVMTSILNRIDPKSCEYYGALRSMDLSMPAVCDTDLKISEITQAKEYLKQHIAVQLNSESQCFQNGIGSSTDFLS